MTDWLNNLQPLRDVFSGNPYLLAGAIVLLGFVLAKVVDLFTTRVLMRATRLTQSNLDDKIIDALHRPLFLTVIFVALVGATRVLNLPDKAASYTVSTVVSIGILVWASFLLKATRLILQNLSARNDLYRFIRVETLPLFHNLAMLLIVGVAVYLIFSAWHIDMTAWLASAGIIGIAVGFAAKDTLANLFSGVFILADTPYKLGDYVVLDSGERGMVTQIGIRSTRLLTRDDVEVTIPNAIMGNSRIVNESGGPHKKYRIRVKVGVAYGSDIDDVRATLMAIADRDPGICKQPEPRVRFRAFGDSALLLELLCWVDDPELRGRALDALYTTIYKSFIEKGIEIPYNKHDIYIKQMPGSGLEGASRG